MATRRGGGGGACLLLCAGSVYTKGESEKTQPNQKQRPRNETRREKHLERKKCCQFAAMLIFLLLTCTPLPFPLPLRCCLPCCQGCAALEAETEVPRLKMATGRRGTRKPKGNLTDWLPARRTGQSVAGNLQLATCNCSSPVALNLPRLLRPSCFLLLFLLCFLLPLFEGYLMKTLSAFEGVAGAEASSRLSLRLSQWAWLVYF